MNDKEIIRQRLLESVVAHLKPNGVLEYRIDKKTFDKVFEDSKKTLSIEELMEIWRRTGTVWFNKLECEIDGDLIKIK